MAIWSLFSQYMGLGDRHCDNILMDIESGALIHIDFECIFERGKHLGCPEVVSFRLTKNLLRALGSFSAFGLYKYYMVEMAKFFIKNVNNLMCALDPFVYDPLIEL